MTELPFRMDLVEWFADHRHPLLTPIFLFFTFLGEMQGFILIVTLLYVAYDKRLAVRLAVLTLVTMSINHILKTVIHNPRPFIHDGTYLTKWAVSGMRASILATEYSTPSGHAMAAAAFYTYAYAVTRNRLVRIAAVVCVLLIGMSRPYLGVHYVEDVFSGWLIGVLLALGALRYGDEIGQRWRRIPDAQRVLILVTASIALWLATWMLSPADPPVAFISYAGLLTGVVVGHELEMQFIGFSPGNTRVGGVLLRYVVCVGLVLATLAVLDASFALLASDASLGGQALRYVRYAAVGIAGMFIGPFLFMRLETATANVGSRQTR